MPPLALNNRALFRRGVRISDWLNPFARHALRLSGYAKLFGDDIIVAPSGMVLYCRRRPFRAATSTFIAPSLVGCDSFSNWARGTANEPLNRVRFSPHPTFPPAPRRSTRFLTATSSRLPTCATFPHQLPDWKCPPRYSPPFPDQTARRHFQNRANRGFLEMSRSSREERCHLPPIPRTFHRIVKESTCYVAIASQMPQCIDAPALAFIPQKTAPTPIFLKIAPTPSRPNT